MTAYDGETDLALTQKEFLILLTLIRRPNRMVEKEELYRYVWGADPGGDVSALHTAISRLNRKLVGAGRRVVYRRGEGYTLEKL